MNLFALLILAVFASDKKEIDADNSQENEDRFGNNEANPIFVKIEEDDYVHVNKKSKYIGVTYSKEKSKWRVQRWNKNENKKVYDGYYDDEEKAAHVSDTLARNLMKSGLKLKFNFSDDNTEVYREEKQSKFIGVYNNNSKWRAQRWSKTENKHVINGTYDDEETAAHASDTLARQLMENGERDRKLNFPDQYSEVYPEEVYKSSKYIGVTYNKNTSKWCTQRWSKSEKTQFSNGYYDDEETAAHASDTLERKLMKNGDQKLKLNFPDDQIEVHPNNQNKKRKRPKTSMEVKAQNGF